MAVPFSRTTRSLASDTSRYALWIWALASAMLCAWLTWFLLVEVTVYEVSRTARLQVERAAHPVAAPIAGRVMSSSVRLGDRVEAGRVLVELDPRTERLRLKEEEARLAAIPPQLKALKRQIADEEQAAERSRAAASSAIAEARWRHQEALSGARFSQEKSLRFSKLRSSGRVAEIEALRAEADADQSQAAAGALSSEMSRLASDEDRKAHEKRAALEALRREAASLNGQIDLSTATIARLRQDIEKHLIRAPVSGEIGEVRPLEIGAFVEAGGVVASIIPSGKLKVIAEFSPPRVLGRVRPGQTARMRLEGFSWAQYGSIAVTVERVAREIRDGRVRVEFLPSSQEDPLLLQHGLPGSVEVEIEKTTPAVLALRAAGQIWRRPAQESEPLTSSDP